MSAHVPIVESPRRCRRESAKYCSPPPPPPPLPAGDLPTQGQHAAVLVLVARWRRRQRGRRQRRGTERRRDTGWAPVAARPSRRATAAAARAPAAVLAELDLGLEVRLVERSDLSLQLLTSQREREQPAHAHQVEPSAEDVSVVRVQTRLPVLQVDGLLPKTRKQWQLLGVAPAFAQPMVVHRHLHLGGAADAATTEQIT